MQTKNRPKGTIGADCLHLTSLLDVEESHYRRLLRLAWRQNSYMKRQDVDRLQANAEEWARHLPRADASRIARERYVAQLAGASGGAAETMTISALLECVEPRVRKQVTATLHRLRNTAAELSRQNELNRSLAEYCLDLAEEESQIFKKGVLADPAGCYGDDAKAASRVAGGFIVKQA